MKMQTFDNATGKIVLNHSFTEGEYLSSCLDRIEKELKELPTYEKGCYTIVHIHNGVTLNRFIV